MKRAALTLNREELWVIVELFSYARDSVSVGICKKATLALNRLDTATIRAIEGRP